jgi:hypothetical protein
MRPVIRYAVMATALLLAGCASVPNSYIPRTVGPLDTARITDALEVRIEPGANIAYIGDLIRFQVSIRNVGERAFWIPREPDMLFTWIYPDGVRDNFVCEFPAEHFYSSDDAILLRPGEEIVTHADIKTYFFPTAGITEFQAFITAGRNTNPALNPFWKGRASSNAYGVVVKSGRDKTDPNGSSAGTFCPRQGDS